MIGCVSEAARGLQSADHVLILTHRRPDGDTTGSAGALCLALRALGKTAYVAENPEITKRYAPYIVPYAPPKGFEPHVIVGVDMAEENMVFEGGEDLAARTDLVIDHHGSNPGFGKYNLIIGERASCAEIVCEVIEELGVPLTQPIAEAIYVGVSTDTGCFRYSNTTAGTLRTAAKCLDAGVNAGELNRVLFETKSRARYEIERVIQGNMQFFRDGKIAVATITLEDRRRTGADWDDMDAIAAMPRQIEGVEVGLTLTELDSGKTKASVRTTKEVDAAAICMLVGGGGHLRAAGATLDCPLEQAVTRMLEATERVYRGETER